MKWEILRIFFYACLTAQISPGQCFFDPCKMFGLCIQVSNNNDRQWQSGLNAQAAPTVNFRRIDSDWITPSDHNSLNAYHFPTNLQTGHDWFEAKKYCASLGGYLVEPLNEADGTFLRLYAGQLGHHNWWTGVRETEKCSCHFNSDERAVSFPILNPSELQGVGLIHISCPRSTFKKCDASSVRWIWTHSRNPLVSYTNWAHEEPNFGEYCAIMWKQKGFKWSDFSCTNRWDGNRINFKPLCQKPLAPPSTTTTVAPNPSKSPRELDDESEEDSNDYEEERPTSREILTDETYCIDQNVIYRGRNVRRPIKFVFSSKRCSELCALTPDCKFWVWRGDKQNSICVLKKNLRRRKFRVQKSDAISGMLEGCPTVVKPSVSSNCSINYNVKSENIEVIERMFGVKTFEECRDKCREISHLCKTWSWVRIHRRDANSNRGTRCTLSSASEESMGYFAFKKGAVSGVFGKDECYDLIKSDCKCVAFDYDYYYGEYEDYGEGDEGIVSTGRIRNNGSSQKFNECEQKKEYNNCVLTSEYNPIITHNTTSKKLAQEDACIEYGVNFNGGSTYALRQNIRTPQECRAECVGECQFWTWKSALSQCLLKKSPTYYPEANAESVSGKVIDGCQIRVPFKDFTHCSCLVVDPEYDYYDENGGAGGTNEGEDYNYSYESEEDEDNSFLSLIDVRKKSQDCPTNLVRKCGVPKEKEDFTANIRAAGASSRIHFGNK